MRGFSTRAIHSGSSVPDAHRSLRMPVYDSVAFEFETAAEMLQAFEGKKLAHAYTRVSNPSVEDLEQRLRSISGAQGVIGLASGMAAIASVVSALGEAGANLVTTEFLFGNTRSFFENTVRSWGMTVRYVNLDDIEAVAGAIDSQTRLLFFESISNPQMQVADVAEIGRICHDRGVPLVVDGTLTTSYLFLSKDWGVDVEVFSGTKYLSGGASCLSGFILDNGNFDWGRSPRLREASRRYGPFALLSALRRQVSRDLGACLAPHHAYLHTLGLETLELRIGRICENATALAHFLNERPEVQGVNYPGLPDSRYHAVAVRQFGGRFGGVLTFKLRSRAECFAFMDRLRIIRRATNMCDNKSLILHPASTIYCDFSPEEREKMGVPDNLIRLSVGIENIEDLCSDLRDALENL